MSITEYLHTLPEDRKRYITALHEAIIANDKTVIPVVESMMGKEMILYKERKYMKYALSSVKNYMSLHCLPMYGSPVLHAKFLALLPHAKFQKGCINFTGDVEMPVSAVAAIISSCSGVSIADLLESRDRKKSKTPVKD
ncbi:MAG: hypothetical protein ACTHMI_06125 [Mucilaginibacter sp.]